MLTNFSVDSSVKYLILTSIVFIVTVSVIFGLLQESENYNVIFITIESTNADHLTHHGYDRNTTPNIDSFAGENIVFKNATAPSASTIYSMPSVFTALYPQTDGVVANNFQETDPSWNNRLSLINKFQNEGYHTKAIVAHEYVKSRWGFDRYFDEFDDDFKQGTFNETPVNNSLSVFEKYDRYWEERNAEETTNLAINFLKDSDRKFFLWLHYFDPHSPYMPPEKKYLEEFQTEYDGKNKTEEYIIYGNNYSFSKSYIHKVRNRYDAELKYTDHHIGRLLDVVEKESLSDNTIIVLTADHGECTGQDNIFDHNKLKWCSLHIPLILHVPGEESRIVEEPVSTIDIFPTLLEALNIDNERYTRGKNLLLGDYRDFHYAESHSEEFLINYGKNRTLEDFKAKKFMREFENKRNISDELENRLEELGYTQ